MPAYCRQPAFFAVWTACCAYIPPVEQQPVVGFGNKFGGDIAYQSLFRLAGGLAVCGQPQPLRDTEDMCIHRHSGLVPYYGADHIRRLPPHTREGLQFLYVVWHFAAIYFRQTLRHCYKVCRFAVRIGYGANIVQHLLDACPCHICRCGVCRE